MEGLWNFLGVCLHLFNRLRSYIIFNVVCIFVLFYLTRIAKFDKKPSVKSPITQIKEGALKVGRGFEKLFVRKNDGEDVRTGADLSMNAANFSIFQGVGLETLDSRGLGREWTRRDERTD